MAGWLQRMFNANERELRRLQGAVAQINELEPEVKGLSDAALRQKTPEFRQRLANGETLDDLLPEAFAVAREASHRVLGMRPFDVQLMGGIVLHEGRIAEMKTGEGKTLVATLPSYLNALAGKGVHVVTVNDYLAHRDSQWMGQLHRYLGLSVGVIMHDYDSVQRQRNYAADITYGTNYEFGFDYLRDNMVLSRDALVQRPLSYAILDEVDSILIDEARTPLIISDIVEKPMEMYYRFAAVVEDLEPDVDYNADEKMQTVAPTEEGIHKVERALRVENLFDQQNMDLSHYLENALKAKALFHRDERYIVKDGEVVIVDEFTGRLMFRRRYGHGLHEAIEAKEGCRIPQGTQTQATITYQNYFRLYEKLAGMTGTAATEEEEFHKIYKLDVVVIPTHEPMVRKDHPDLVYSTERAKFRAVVNEIRESHAHGQPVLVGTVDINKNERLSKLLEREGITHQILNAKHHEKEAQIIAQAGRLGAVTIATNMAGRGTDIILGGNPGYLARERLQAEGIRDELLVLASEHAPQDPDALAEEAAAVGATPEAIAQLRERYSALTAEFKRETDAEHQQVVQAGGLRVIGTERHESRRIDNQLRGRSGRQGDPGASRFYLSLEDSLMRLFGGEFLQKAMDWLKVDEDEPIESPMVTRALERAQKKVEARNFDARKQVLDYDDVLNQQREVTYAQRRETLVEADCHPIVERMRDDLVHGLVLAHAPDKADPEEWDLQGLVRAAEQFFLPADTLAVEELRELDGPVMEKLLIARAQAAYTEREEQIGAEAMREYERQVLLRVVNTQWIEHLEAMDDLREGIGLRAYGQLDPLTQYKIEAFEMFEEMVGSIRQEVVRLVHQVRFVPMEPQPEEQPQLEAPAQPAALPQVTTVHVESTGIPVPDEEAALTTPAPRGAGAADEAPPARAAVAATAVPALPPPRLRVVGGSQVGQGGKGTKQKVGRNDPCPCGSGKKYKHCHGR